jgi:hypothetical protein
LLILIIFFLLGSSCHGHGVTQPKYTFTSPLQVHTNSKLMAALVNPLFSAGMFNFNYNKVSPNFIIQILIIVLQVWCQVVRFHSVWAQGAAVVVATTAEAAAGAVAGVAAGVAAMAAAGAATSTSTSTFLWQLQWQVQRHLHHHH